MAKKTQITKAERLQLIGLLTIAHQAYGKMKECDIAMVEIVGKQDEYQSAGLLSDEYFEDTPNVDKCLKYMKIKVKKIIPHDRTNH